MGPAAVKTPLYSAFITTWNSTINKKLYSHFALIAITQRFKGGNKTKNKQLTFAAGIVAIFFHFWRTDASFDVQFVDGGRVVPAFHRAAPWTGPCTLSARDGTRRPVGPATPHAFAWLQIADALHQSGTVTVGRSEVTGSVAAPRPLLPSSSALARTFRPVWPFRPTAFRVPGICLTRTKWNNKFVIPARQIWIAKLLQCHLLTSCCTWKALGFQKATKKLFKTRSTRDDNDRAVFNPPSISWFVHEPLVKHKRPWNKEF